MLLAEMVQGFYFMLTLVLFFSAFKEDKKAKSGLFEWKKQRQREKDSLRNQICVPDNRREKKHMKY